MSGLRQTEASKTTVGGYQFYIKPLPAFKAANLTGELASVLMPLLAAIAPLVDAKGSRGLIDLDVDKAAPDISKAFEGLSGDKVELLLKKLLTSHRNIVVELQNENTDEIEQEVLTDDIVNEIFCGEIQDMFILAYYVIQQNFNGFFKKAGNLFGKAGAPGKKSRKVS